MENGPVFRKIGEHGKSGFIKSRFNCIIKLKKQKPKDQGPTIMFYYWNPPNRYQWIHIWQIIIDFCGIILCNYDLELSWWIGKKKIYILGHYKLTSITITWGENTTITSGLKVQEATQPHYISQNGSCEKKLLVLWVWLNDKIYQIT